MVEQKLKNRPLFTHMFILMGATEFQFLDILLFQDEFSKIKANLRGLVFDRCPGRPANSIKSFFHAIADHVLNEPFLWGRTQAVGQFFWVIRGRIAAGGKDD